MPKKVYLVSLLLSISLFMTSPVFAKRIALVIGNNDYKNVSKLKKAVNDANSIADTLRNIGFVVIHFQNLKNRSMGKAIYDDFLSKINKNDEALFYFAGHAIEIKNRNYLLATDIPVVKSKSKHFLMRESFAVDEIMYAMEERGSRVNILILDACRNNPFPNNVVRALGAKRGLAKIDPPKGSFVMYSAGARQTALDRLNDEDPNSNSVFTRKLLPLLKKPGISLNKMAVKLRVEVEELAKTVGHDQYPAYYDQLRGDFVFVPVNSEKQKKYNNEKQQHSKIQESDLLVLQSKLNKLEATVKKQRLRELEREEQQIKAQEMKKNQEMSLNSPPSRINKVPRCGWFVISYCTKFFEVAKRKARQYGGYVIFTSNPMYPNFTNGWYCSVEGPTNRSATNSILHVTKKRGATDAYIKNSCK